MTSARSARYFLSALSDPDRCHPVWIAHEGVSMSPSLRPGDRLLVEPHHPREPRFQPRPGDVIVVRRGGVLVAHRVVCWDGPLVVTRGDAVPVNDPPIEGDQVAGRVIQVERHGRRFAPPEPPLRQILRLWVRELYVQAEAGIDAFLRRRGAGLSGPGGRVEGELPGAVVRRLLRKAARQSSVCRRAGAKIGLR